MAPSANHESFLKSSKHKLVRNSDSLGQAKQRMVVAHKDN